MKSSKHVAPLLVVKSVVNGRGGASADNGSVDALLCVTGAVDYNVCGCAETIPTGAGA